MPKTKLELRQVPKSFPMLVPLSESSELRVKSGHPELEIEDDLLRLGFVDGPDV